MQLDTTELSGRSNHASRLSAIVAPPTSTIPPIILTGTRGLVQRRLSTYLLSLSNIRTNA